MSFEEFINRKKNIENSLDSKSNIKTKINNIKNISNLKIRKNNSFNKSKIDNYYTVSVH